MKLRKLAKHLIYGSRIYNYYLSQVNIIDINNIPMDPWPGDPFLGENILQGNLSLAGKKNRQKNLYGLTTDKTFTGKMKFTVSRG